MVKNRYDAIIEAIFDAHYKEGMKEFVFDRAEINIISDKLNISRIKNVGDLPYTYRFRKDLPEKILKKSDSDKDWIILLSGIGKYKFVQRKGVIVVPNDALAETKIPDSTPEIISKYAISDEQATLARLRYNRIVDIFTGVTCYSLQNHLRTTVTGIGQIEIDELYVGIDRNGAHYILPVQAKSHNDRLTIVQPDQDITFANIKYPNTICYSIGAKLLDDNLIAMYRFEQTSEGPRIVTEAHYRLVPNEDLSDLELQQYRDRLQ